MNEHSSRSHAIFLVTVECSERGADGEDHIRVGKLNMVDLAGSERQAKTGATVRSRGVEWQRMGGEEGGECEFIGRSGG